MTRMSEENSEVPHKVHVPEPPVSFGSTFLNDYWNSKDPLPSLSPLELVGYFLLRGFHTITALPGSSVITVLTIAVSLFLLAGFMLTLQNVSVLLNAVGTSTQVTAYFREDATESTIMDLVRSLESDTRIRAAEYVSKERALELFKESLGSRGSILQGLDKHNPLPRSVDILLRQSTSGERGLQSFVAELHSNPLLSDVVYGSEWVEQIQGVINIVKGFGYFSTAIIVVVVLFLISNTIKLVIYSRRDEISIMQLVGASASYIRIPFVLGGLFQGLVGSVLGIGLLWCAHVLLVSQLSGISIMGFLLSEPVFLSASNVGLLIFLGMLVGACGSFLALGKFMHV